MPTTPQRRYQNIGYAALDFANSDFFSAKPSIRLLTDIMDSPGSVIGEVGTKFPTAENGKHYTVAAITEEVADGLGYL